MFVLRLFNHDAKRIVRRCQPGADHREGAGRVVGADECHSAGDLGLVDLGEHDLALLGYDVTVFEAAGEPGLILDKIASAMTSLGMNNAPISQGEFFIILDGTATVTRDGQVVATLGPGDHFGEISLLDGDVRTASVIAETDMTLLEITQKVFFAMLSKDPEITVDLLEGVARAVRRMDRSLAG